MAILSDGTLTLLERRDTMTQKIYVTPGAMTSLQAKLGIVVFVFFLLFGLVFGLVVFMETPDSESGQLIAMGAFFLVWVVVCISCIVTFMRLLSKKKTPQEKSLVDFNFEELPDMAMNKSADFEIRLRKLEQLKQDRLITEEEYQGKRTQIINEKW